MKKEYMEALLLIFIHIICSYFTRGKSCYAFADSFFFDNFSLEIWMAMKMMT